MNEIQELIDQTIDSPLTIAELSGVWGNPETALYVIHRAMQRGFVQVQRDGETVPMWKLERVIQSRAFETCRPWLVSCTDEGAKAWLG